MGKGLRGWNFVLKAAVSRENRPAVMASAICVPVARAQELIDGAKPTAKECDRIRRFVGASGKSVYTEKLAARTARRKAHASPFLSDP